MFERRQHPADALAAAYDELNRVHEKIRALKSWLSQHDTDLRGERYVASIYFGQVYLSELAAPPPEGAPVAASPAPEDPPAPKPPLAWMVPGGRFICTD